MKLFHGVKNKFAVPPAAACLSAVTGFCVAALVYINYFQLPLFSKRYLLLAGLIAAIITCLVILIYKALFAAIVAQLSKNIFMLVLLAALLMAVALTFAFPIEEMPLYFLYPKQDVRLEFSVNNSDDRSMGVALAHINTNFRDISFSELKIDGNCDIREDRVFCGPGQTVRIDWRGVVGDNLVIKFLPTQFRQTTAVHWNNTVDQVQLQSRANQQIIVERRFEPPVDELLIIQVLLLPIIFLIVLFFMLGLFGQLSYASALIFIWLIFLLIYWPGIIGDVNLSLVQDFSTGQIDNWHPVFYTLLLDVFVRLFSSAASLLIFQIIVLALAINRGLRFLKQKGCSKAVLWILTLVIALLPPNFLSLISLTNDIPFSIFLFIITLFVMEIVFSNGEWLEKPLNTIIFALSALAAVLFRYNGIPAIAFSVFCLFIVLHKLRKRLAAISGALIFLYMVINGSVFNLLGVNNVIGGHFNNVLLHHISAHIDAGTPIDGDDRIYLSSVYPLDQWNYSCCSNGIMWIKPELNKVLFHENPALNRKIALDLFLKNPKVEIDHIFCAGDMVWNIPGKCEVRGPAIYKIDNEYYWTRSDFPEYRENSKLPKLVNTFSEIIITFEKNKLLNTLFWRPAVYLYLAIIAVLVFRFRYKNTLALLILAPLLGQSIFLFFFNRIQNFRYQYCAVLIGVFLLGLLFLPKPVLNDHS